MTYYCKNCKNIVGEWNCKSNYNTIFCKLISSSKFNTIYFLNCKNCKHFIGIYCNSVCENCFGKDEIFGEENLKKWFLKYKKIKPNCLYNYCKKCNKTIFRWQYWFFKELTFYK